MTVKSSQLNVPELARQPDRSDLSLVDYQGRLRRAAVEISLASERERRAIAGDVHDNISQELAIANLRLGELCARSDGESLLVLNEIRARVAGALQSCRALTYSLATPSLYKLGLIPAVKNLLAEFAKSHQLIFATNITDDDITLTSVAEVILYRVIRELLLNVVKHAQAKKVEISITFVADELKVVIADDGVGFDTMILNEFNPDSGLGLFLLRERMLHLGGSFNLVSAPGKGTRASLAVSCAAADLPVE